MQIKSKKADVQEIMKYLLWAAVFVILFWGATLLLRKLGVIG